MTELERLECLVDFSSDSLSASFIEGFAALTSLTRLRLKGSGIGTKGVKALAKAAQAGSFPKLLHLRMETVGVQASAVKVHIPSGLFPSALRVWRVQLQGSHFLIVAYWLLRSHWDPAVYFNGEQHMCSRHELKCYEVQSQHSSFSCTYSTLTPGASIRQFDDMQELALGLPNLKGLLQMSLSFTKCKDGTVDSLLTHLTQFSVLTCLDLMHARLPDASVLLLNHALSKMPSLARLSLSNAVIGTSGINLLTRALPKLTGLSFLSLSACPIGDKGAGVLADALKGLYRLRELHLNSTDVTDHGACAVLTGLSHVFLTHVRFKSNPRMKGCPAVASGILKEPWVVLA